MTKPGAATITLPNPHRGDISVDLLSRILRVANIDRRDWENARRRTAATNKCDAYESTKSHI